ncbi:hypothetical protein [Glutamicibacter sp.]|uniref:hypothetical protein n=1 Tax=Glutamicibacter sp. TaxID=1931995 RepID=UPI003D6B3421
MVSREQLVQRAAVAARLSRDLTNKRFHDRLVSVAPVDDEGDAVVVAAGAEESAVVTIHRIERSAHQKVAMATLVDDQIRVIVMQHTEGTSGLIQSIPGGLSVEGWVRLMDKSRGGTFNADGSEFKQEIEGISIALL